MADLFMQKYFPPEKTTKLKNRIMTFKQDGGESLHAAWERFKDLLIDVPHHGLSKRQLVLNFYQGLNYDSQERIDVYTGGDLGTKTPTEAYAIIEKTTLKSSSRHSGVRNKALSIPGVQQVDTYTALAAQIGALAARFDQAKNVSKVQSSCEQCGVSHEPGTCEQGVMFTGHEEVDYLGNQIRPQNNPYSNTYNPGWKNHPNFGWKSNSGNQNPLGYAQRAPAPQQPQAQPYQSQGQSFQPHYHHQGSGSSSQPHGSQSNSKLEEMMTQLLGNFNCANQIAENRYQQHEERFMAQEGEIRSQKASI
ncbi:putative retrotransposon gag domain-containing protein [Helianthus annuus]|nr:putative retrotransposon gag domain-containing protein [Helianthus annuus]KAJ0711128.1 putative retrotransposon gag domain-containing protein [Helianthus annuus]